jgi:proton-translocating NADH-quinone oxidoreductase chain M
MTDSSLILAAILIPAIGSLLLPLIGAVSKKARNGIAALLVLSALVANAALIPTVFWSGQVVEASLVGFRLLADGLAVFVGASSSLISFIIVIYSFDYIDHYDHQNEYYLMVVLFLGSMMGLVFSGNLILLFIFWELTAIASWRLIGFFRKEGDILRANKAFLVTVFGALLMLVGFVMLWQSTGSFDLTEIKTRLQGSPISDLALILILAGILSKSATFPFHTWLPDAGVAPSPVTSLLHAAVLVKIGVYVFARLFVVSFSYSAFGHSLVLVLAAASALISAGAALVETDLKRIIAYSTVSQIGFIFLGFAAGTSIGVTGALLYILMHGLAKGGLFLCAGIVEQQTHTKDITRLGGLWRTMPITALSFLLCALSVMGVPPFGGFFSKAMVIMGAVEAGRPWIAATFVLGAVFTILYLLRVFNRVFLGESADDPHPREGSRTMVGSVATLTVLSVVAGVAINWPGKLAETAVNQMLGMIK